MKKTALLFPGQGSQKTSMVSLITDDVLEKASEILGYNLDKIIENPVKLNCTKFTQPAVFTASYSLYNQIEPSLEEISFLLGHSLGEWTAAVAARCISFEDGLRAVNERAQLMDYYSKNGAMAAIIGISASEVEHEIKEIDNIEIANYNLPKQTVVSGNADSIREFIKLTKVKAIPLKVSGAFHSRFMLNAEIEFKKSISNLNFKNAQTSIILNSNALPETNGLAIKNSLIKQLTSPVYFYQSVEYAVKQGVNSFYEVGSSRVLTNMVKKIDSSVNVCSAEEFDLEQRRVNNSTNTVTG